MKALIFGCSGQDGTLLSELLINADWEVAGTTPKNYKLSDNHPMRHNKRVYFWDAVNDSALEFIDDVNPDVVFYLAGVTSVSESWKDPAKTFQVNTLAYTRLLEKLINRKKLTKVIYASSVEIFEDEKYVREDSPMSSSTPYGISKIAGTQIGRAFRKNGLWVSNAILSNHESYMRSEDFVTGKIAKSVAAIHKGNKNKLVIGNLKAVKNWSAASDVVEGIKRIAENSESNDYIIAYPQNTELERLIEIAFSSIGIQNWQDFIEIDEKLIRKVENVSKNYSTEFASKKLNWNASTPPEIWMKEMVNFHISSGL